MRRSYTAVIEQGNAYGQDFQTEPYEAGWASEARWFIRILGDGRDEGGHDGLRVVAQPEISPDGLVWLPADCEPIQLPAAAEALASRALGEFGNWLRLNVKLDGTARQVKFVIYLALKE